MAYTNYTEQVLQGLRAILGTEFGSKPVILWGEQDKRPASEYFELRLVRTSPADVMGSLRGRLYHIRIDHLVSRKGAEFPRVTTTGERIERMEQLLWANRSYPASGEYRWHDIELGDCDYLAATEQDDIDGYSRASQEIVLHVDKLN